jgi:hypothetical protein
MCMVLSSSAQASRHGSILRPTTFTREVKVVVNDQWLELKCVMQCPNVLLLQTVNVEH